jgi:cytochrome bd-type quinol oxidase subunit 2
LRVSDRSGIRWAIAALVWTVVIGAVWLVVPLGSYASSTVLSDGTQVNEAWRETLLQSEGVSVVGLLAVPVVVAGIAVGASRSRHARRVRFVMGGVLFAACLLAAASIGLPYVPAAVGLLLAGAATARERIAA